MANLGKVQLGMAMLSLCGLCHTGNLVFAKVMNDLHFPSWYIMCGGNISLALAFGSIFLVTKAALPKRLEGKWVFGRSMFGMLSFVSAVQAVQVGAAPGDVAALTSVNIVVAAIMGHLFLSERLNYEHVGALMCSIIGAVFISKPSFLFGTDGRDSPWIGYLLALSSGFLQASEFICARKSADVSVNLLSLFMSVSSLPVFLLLGWLREGTPSAVANAMSSMAVTLSFIAVSCALGFGAILAGTVGSVLCPAAISATMFTCSSMVLGYAAQTVLFGQAPSLLTIVGAVMMLFAVGIMAATRVPKPGVDADLSLDRTVPEASASEGHGDNTGTRASSHVSEEDDAESLVSFVAAEFATVGPHLGSVRFRGPGLNDKATGDVLGVVTKATAIAIVAL